MAQKRSITRNKSKKRKREWFNDLTEEQKLKYLDKQSIKRTMRRNAQSDMIMHKMKLFFDCKLCFHGITRNCKRKKNGCVYFYDAIKEDFGPAYAA